MRSGPEPAPARPPPSGFKLPCQLHQVIVARFADDDLIIDFDNFVRCLIRLETLFSKWPLGEDACQVPRARAAAFHVGGLAGGPEARLLRVEILLSLGEGGKNDSLGDR